MKIVTLSGTDQPWYYDEKYSSDAQAFAGALLSRLQSNPDYSGMSGISYENVAPVFGAYVEYCYRSGKKYEGVNPEEKTRFLADDIIRGVYMIIKGVDESTLSTVSPDYVLRDIIWISCSEIWKMASESTAYEKWWNPSQYVDPALVAPVPASEIATMPEVVPVSPAVIPAQGPEMSTSTMMLIGAAALVAVIMLGSKK